MLATVKAGWTADKGRDELDAQITLVGNDPQDVAHLLSLKDDDWDVAVSIQPGDVIVIDIKGTRKVPLAEQVEAKRVADEAAAADAQAKADESAKANEAQAAADARLQKLAGAAAASAVKAVLDAEKQ